LLVTLHFLSTAKAIIKSENTLEKDMLSISIKTKSLTLNLLYSLTVIKNKALYLVENLILRLTSYISKQESAWLKFYCHKNRSNFNSRNTFQLGSFKI